jgi:hypothetical protein
VQVAVEIKVEERYSETPVYVALSEEVPRGSFETTFGQEELREAMERLLRDASQRALGQLDAQALVAESRRLTVAEAPL